MSVFKKIFKNFNELPIFTRTGVLLVLFGASIVFFSLIRNGEFNSFYSKVKTTMENTTSNKTSIEEVKEDDNQDTQTQSISWKEYVINDYRIAYKTPRMLLRTQYEDPGEYEFFVRHEETEESTFGKGVALGITTRSVDDELDYIMQLISIEDKSIDPTKTDIKVRGNNGFRLDYPANEDWQAKSFIVFSDGNYTFSISTITDQIQKLVDSVRLF